jgi:hypothetical protein
MALNLKREGAFLFLYAHRPYKKFLCRTVKDTLRITAIPFLAPRFSLCIYCIIGNTMHAQCLLTL